MPGESIDPIFPNVPTSMPDPPQDNNEVNDEIDFDEVTRR